MFQKVSQVESPRSYVKVPGSADESQVLGPTYGSRVAHMGPRSRVLGPTFHVCPLKGCLLDSIGSKKSVRNRFFVTLKMELLRLMLFLL